MLGYPVAARHGSAVRHGVRSKQARRQTAATTYIVIQRASLVKEVVENLGRVAIWFLWQIPKRIPSALYTHT